MGRYRVFYRQINPTYFDVSANNKEDAMQKARAKWCEFLDDCKDDEVEEIDRIG